MWLKILENRSQTFRHSNWPYYSVTHITGCFVQGLLPQNFLSLETYQGLEDISSQGIRSGQNALAEMICGYTLYTQNALRWLHPSAGQSIRVVCQVRFGLCWFGFSNSSGFLGRAVLVLLGCQYGRPSMGYRTWKKSPDPQSHAQGDGKVTGVVVGHYENGRALPPRHCWTPEGSRSKQSPTLPTCPCLLPGRPWDYVLNLKEQYHTLPWLQFCRQQVFKEAAQQWPTCQKMHAWEKGTRSHNLCLNSRLCKWGPSCCC